MRQEEGLEFSGRIDRLTKEYILDRVSEEEIMRRYLSIPIELGRLFRSPLRKDKKPTCVFSYHKGRLRFRDWAEPISKDCFDIVQEVYGCSYYESLEIVANEFNIEDRPVSSFQEKKKENEKYEKSGKSVIQVKIQEFTPIDIAYLKSFGINREICRKFRCYSIEYLWINGRRYHIYVHTDPMIGYYFGKGEDGSERWKIYFYKRRKESNKTRFICNTNRINAWVQIPETGPFLLITKSMKDVMTLYRLGIPSIAMQNETTLLYDYLAKELKERFNKIFSLYDFDYTGIRMANLLRKEYDIQPLFLTNGRFDTRDMGAKDISDFVRDNGLRRTRKIVKYAKEHYGIPSGNDSDS